jgi:hypothetical protein
MDTQCRSSIYPCVFDEYGRCEKCGEVYNKPQPARVARKMTRAEFTAAVNRYARKHNFSTDFIRVNTTLRWEAIRAYEHVISIHCTGLEQMPYKPGK